MTVCVCVDVTIGSERDARPGSGRACVVRVKRFVFDVSIIWSLNIDLCMRVHATSAGDEEKCVCVCVKRASGTIEFYAGDILYERAATRGLLFKHVLRPCGHRAVHGVWGQGKRAALCDGFIAMQFEWFYVSVNQYTTGVLFCWWVGSVNIFFGCILIARCMWWFLCTCLIVVYY